MSLSSSDHESPANSPCCSSPRLGQKPADCSHSTGGGLTPALAQPPPAGPSCIGENCSQNCSQNCSTSLITRRAAAPNTNSRPAPACRLISVLIPFRLIQKEHCETLAK